MFHKEGFNIIIFDFLISVSLVISIEILIDYEFLKQVLQGIILLKFIMILWFFRNPKREVNKNQSIIVSPADGKIVNIEEVFENEFFKDKRLQVSIFLSPLDVHVNRYPVSGEVLYSEHHHGKYFVAWHPKSSEKNERTTVVIKNEKFGNIMYRQIAGMVARRIVNYAKVDIKVEQGDDSGFIKFGSRVDLFIPLKSKLIVNKGDRVVGGISEIAKLR